VQRGEGGTTGRRFPRQFVGCQASAAAASGGLIREKVRPEAIKKVAEKRGESFRRRLKHF